MAVNYARMAALAERLIRENGRTVTLSRQSRTPTNPAKPWEGATVATTKDVPAVDYPFEASDVDGGRVKAGDTRYMIAADSGLEVETFDALVDGSVRWGVVSVEKIAPGPVRVCYILHARR